MQQEPGIGDSGSLIKIFQPSVDVIAALPKKHVDKSISDSEDETQCGICLEGFKEGDKSTDLPCIHMFTAFAWWNG